MILQDSLLKSLLQSVRLKARCMTQAYSQVLHPSVRMWWDVQGFHFKRRIGRMVRIKCITWGILV